MRNSESTVTAPEALHDDIEANVTDIPKAFRPLPYMPGRVNAEGKNVGQKLAAYFMEEGAVDCQCHAIK